MVFFITPRQLRRAKKAKAMFAENQDDKKILLFAFTATLLFLCLAFTVRYYQNRRQQPFEGIVLSHHTTGGQGGRIYYHTVIKSADGLIKSVEGIEYFALPVGANAKVQ